MNEIIIVTESLWYLTLSLLNIVICFIIYKVWKRFDKIVTYGEYQRLLKILIDFLNGLLDVWEKGQESRSFKPTANSTFSRSKESTGGSQVPTVDALPPDIIAPSLKGMQKSSGFGPSKSKKESDS